MQQPIAMLFGATLLGTACAANKQDETGAADVRNVDQVTDSPEDHIGRSITVRGASSSWSSATGRS